MKRMRTHMWWYALRLPSLIARWLLSLVCFFFLDFPNLWFLLVFSDQKSSLVTKGLTIRVRLLRALPDRFKVDIMIKEGTHQSEKSVNKVCSFFIFFLPSFTLIFFCWILIFNSCGGDRAYKSNSTIKNEWRQLWKTLICSMLFNNAFQQLIYAVAKAWNPLDLHQSYSELWKCILYLTCTLYQLTLEGCAKFPHFRVEVLLFWILNSKKTDHSVRLFFFLAFSLYHDPVKIRISFAPNLAFWLKRNITNTWPVFFFWPNRADDVMASSSKVQNPFESVLKNMSKRCGAIYMNDVGGM